MKNGKAFTERATDKYRIRSTGASSEKYGPCQCCGNHASEVFILNHQVRYIDPELGPSWTRYGAITEGTFGHEACLRLKVNAFRVEVT